MRSLGRLTARTIEIFVKGERVAAHMRGSGNGKHTTVPEHMPASHRRYAGWTIERIRRDAAAIGPTPRPLIGPEHAGPKTGVSEWALRRAYCQLQPPDAGRVALRYPGRDRHSRGPHHRH